jgi:hypothetical protein
MDWRSRSERAASCRDVAFKPSSDTVCSVAAADALLARADEQQKLKEMLEEIAEIAASTPVGLAHAWNTSFNRPLLQLRLGRITLRYAIDEDTRTISVEHVLVPEEGVGGEGDPPVGKVG